LIHSSEAWEKVELRERLQLSFVSAQTQQLTFSKDRANSAKFQPIQGAVPLSKPV
jgi:hypothetical protein